MSTLDTVKALAAQLAEMERATEFRVRKVAIPGPEARTAALITMDNGFDHTKPTTLGFNGLLNMAAALDEVEQLAQAGEISAAAITGKPFIFAAGADLSLITMVSERAHARALAEFGHEQMGRLHRLGVPSFAFVNGLALGGGLEVALGCDYRTMQDGISVALPETMLGLVPGWGGCYRLPRLIGAAKAIEVIVANPLQQNKMLSARAAHEMGIADAVFGGAGFLVESLRWAGQVLSGEVTPERVDHTQDPAWQPTVSGARALVDARTGGMAPAPDRALDLIAAAQTSDEAAGFRAEDNALTDLVMGDEFRASIYAFNLVQKRGKKPANAPDKELARKVTKVGIVGAGLMASQLALLFARRLEVPVVMSDVDSDRLERGLGYVRAEVEKLVSRGRLGRDGANRILGQVTGSVAKEAYADAEFVIEAVFEDLEVKRQVFRELEAVVPRECVLATNTSSLSVTAMADGLDHPERVVGFHFFNPVAVMPLVEIVRAERTDEATRATAFAVARGLKKTVIGVDDAPSFVVNRLLGRFMSEIGRVVDEGTSIEAADRVVADLAPMPPFQLMGLVGPAIALHNNESLAAAFGDRFAVPRVLRRIVELGKPGFYLPAKPGDKPQLDTELVQQLQVGDGFSTPGRVRGRVLDALADEARRMIDEGVVADPSDIDVAMITGAGFSFWNGGLLPMLDREGTAELVTGRRFLEPGVASLPR
ncbi:3-hydroxyacyl-CoA dehydrogenase NAD-binding domain-containing protein [Granulicoccus sp. GXG6511]|uniref:3-hydroxyacyl-CoA dehydrogenase NAD-binding domain-containing protein n=1 Tax=Granulicoccus sp. GXG6511 TaxID=3381351 RepID=UPI003D7DF391